MDMAWVMGMGMGMEYGLIWSSWAAVDGMRLLLGPVEREPSSPSASTPPMAAPRTSRESIMPF